MGGAERPKTPGTIDVRNDLPQALDDLAPGGVVDKARIRRRLEVARELVAASGRREELKELDPALDAIIHAPDQTLIKPAEEEASKKPQGSS